MEKSDLGRRPNPIENEQHDPKWKYLQNVLQPTHWRKYPTRSGGTGCTIFGCQFTQRSISMRILTTLTLTEIQTETERKSEKVPDFLWWRLGEEFLLAQIKPKHGTRPYAGTYYQTLRAYKYNQKSILAWQRAMGSDILFFNEKDERQPNCDGLLQNEWSNQRTSLSTSLHATWGQNKGRTSNK